MSTAIGVSLPRLAAAVGKAVSEYAVLGKTPGFTADFIKNKYPGKANFASAITHSRSGNAVMTDGYGPELVVNGGFDSNVSGFSAGGTASLSFSLSALNVNSGSSDNGYAYQAVSTIIGKTYEFVANKRGNRGYITAGNSIGNTALGNSGTNTDSKNTLVFVATATTTYIGLFCRDSNKTTTFDNVSVREMPVLKWAPHNLLTYSEEFDNGAWTTINSSVSPNTKIAVNGQTTADTLNFIGGGSASSIYGTSLTLDSANTYSIGVFVKHEDQQWIQIHGSSTIWGSSTYANFDVQNGAVGTVSGYTSSSIEDVGNGWYKITVVGSPSSSGSTAAPMVIAGVDSSSSTRASSLTASNTSIHIWGAHLYRSDLGGMVDNPDQPLSRASYVPTTSSAKYLPRIGHHVYNGSAWVNEGLLAESEQRVNLVTYSESLSSWNLAGLSGRLSITDDQSVGPDGTTSLSRTEVKDGIGGGKIITNEIAYTSGDQVAISCYFKPDEYTTFAIGLGDGENNWTRVVFDTSSVSSTQQSVGASSGTVHDYGITDAGAGLYYAWAVVSVTDDGDSLADVAFMLTSSATPTLNTFGAESFVGTTGQGAYAGFIQAEAASTPSSYIPTSGQQGTRAAESFTIPSANLPWPTPQIISSELVTSGTFDDSSALDDWTTSGSVSVVSGEAVIADVGGTDAYISQQLSGVVTGEIVILTFDQSAGTNLIVQVGFSAGSNLDNQFSGYGVGSHEIIIVAKRDNPWLSFRSFFTDTSNTIDNVSVREINPLSVSIAMEGRMTYADEGENFQIKFLQWLEDGSNFIESSVTTASTTTGRMDFRQEVGGTNDFVSSGNTYFSPDILVPYNIASRHGSTFINGATDGVALTADTDPTRLPDLSSTDLNLAYDYMGTISEFRVWDKDIGDAGIVEATNPSLEPSLSLTFEGAGTNSFVVNNWSE